MCKVKRAIFVAAGLGTRLRPITLTTPKPLVEVNGKRIMDRSLEALFANGIEEVYLVVGHLKEKFYELYGNDPRIHIVENPHYLEGNSITSLYQVRDMLPESFVLEADIVINDPSVLNADIDRSGYLAAWKTPAREWVLDVRDGVIEGCEITAERDAYQLWGISMWTKEDGEKLSELIARKYESGQWNVYWDEIALFEQKDQFELGIRIIDEDALMEIDTVAELAAIDPTYSDCA